MDTKSSVQIIKDITEKNKDKTFLIDNQTGESITYQKLYDDAVALTEFFESIGLKKGDRLVLMLDNSQYFAKLYFACLYGGIIAVPINPIYKVSQIKTILDSINAKCIIHSENTLSEDDIDILGYNRELFYQMDETNATIHHKLTNRIVHLDQCKSSGGYDIMKTLNDNDILTIIFTSGTTAEPKGVVHTIGNIVTNAMEFCTCVGINENCRFYNNLAMTYLGGYYNLLILPFIAQGSVVLDNTFNANSVLYFWKPIIKYKVNTLWLIPTMIAILVNFDRGNEGVEYCKNGIFLSLVGTAPLPEKNRKKFEKKYNLNLIENYGLSETLFIATQKISEVSDSKSVGKILQSVSVKVLDKENREVATGEEGEIWVSTSYLMNGYYNLEEENAGDRIKNWFATGDLGYVQNNELYISGRKKDLIIRGGINISPKYIEDVIHSHDDVEECAIVGVPNDLLGEEIIGIIKKKQNSAKAIEEIKIEIIAKCQERLAPIQQPSQIIELDEFPHSTSGKILKNKLKAWVVNKSLEKSKQREISNINPQNGEESSRGFFQASRVVSESIQAVSIRYNNSVYEMKRSGIDVTVLSLGEAFFDIPLLDFSELPFPNIYHYSHSRGIIELRKNIAQYFNEKYDFNFNPETEIIVTAGSKIAIHMALMAVVNPGDEVIVYEPAWVSYPEQIKLCYGVPVRIPYYENVFNFEKYVTNRTKVIIINSPNNPTGKVFTIEELVYLNKLARKYNLYILSDEAYSDFILDNETFVSLGNLDTNLEHTIVVNSISKNYGISGWRLGYVITNRDLINQILKINQHLITCPATILEYYIAKNFFHIIKITKPQINSVVEKRKEITEYMSSVGLKYLDGTATFYIFASIAPSMLSSEEFCTRLLEEEKICIVPGSGYGDSCDQFVRIAVGAESMKRTKEGILKIKKLIEKTS